MTAHSTPLHDRSAEDRSLLSRAGELVPTAVRACIVLVLTAAALFYAYKSIRWQIMVDSPVMHYVNFLMDHGRKPYTDITDNNMPGAYYTESLAMHVFGYGDLAWRFYDYFLLATLTGGLILMVRRYDWLAGLFAGGLFIAVHAAEGPQYSVEREQVLTVLLVLGYVALFAGVRRLKPSLMLWVGIAGGLATSIKPTFLPLTLGLLAMMAVVLWRRKVSPLAYLVWAFAGLIAIALVDLGFLLRYHALGGFWFVLRVITPTYAGLGRPSYLSMLTLCLSQCIPLIVLTVAAWVVCRRKPVWAWEHWAIAMGSAFGLASYMVQGKPFWHHRYTFLVFLFLLIGLVLLHALRESGLPRLIACGTVAYVLLWMVPMDMREVLHIARQMPTGQAPFTNSLEADLQRLSGPDGAANGYAALQDRVQCFDLVYGCLNTLYHLRLVENTSYTGDLLLFTHGSSVAAEYYRDKYWAAEKTDPASVIVMSNEWFQKDNSFDKVKEWPAFEAFLARNYTLVVQRRFAHQGKDPNNPEAYRIYVRNGSSLLQRAAVLQAAPAL
jgi:hypothetical protein